MSVLHIEDDLVVRVAHRLAEKRIPEGSDPRRSIAPASGPSAERLLRDQPEVLAFVLAGASTLSAEARAAGVFLSEVIFDVFRLAGRTTRQIAPQQFITALRGNREMALRVGQAHDKIAERYLRNSNTLKQPAVIRYVTGVLLDPDAAVPHAIPREELGPLFIVLKSIIDVLDEDAAAIAEPSALSSPPA